MAMSKKEQETVRELKRKLSVLAALRWTDAVHPDIPIPDFQTITKGWMTGYERADKAMSSSISHKRGDWEDRSWSQQPRALYSTELLALKALRHEMEEQFAEKLASVDLQIARAKGEAD